MFVIPFISALAVFTACNPDLLEIPQKGVIYTEDFYQTDQDAEAALNEFRHDSASEVLYKAYSRFYTVDTHAAIDAGYTVGFKADKHELFPFPEKVTRVNNVLVQNKGSLFILYNETGLYIAV